MCGIAGIINFKRLNDEKREKIIQNMISIINHRGPDERGVYLDSIAAMGHVRLSIIDLESGQQPMFNEDRTICIVFNGEIYNYRELRADLVAEGHIFATESDTEVIIHGYESYSTEFIKQLNGQFAFAIWDAKRRSVMLARDRLGIRPLYLTKVSTGELIFASEVKSIFCHPSVTREFDHQGLGEIFKFWVNIPPHTVFKNIEELPPGMFLQVSEEKEFRKKYWDLGMGSDIIRPDVPLSKITSDLYELLYDAVNIRLRADVPVGAYLSGGLDSTIIASIIKQVHQNELRTYSINFDDDDYDEGFYQQEAISYFGIDHNSLTVNDTEICDSISDVVWYAERPLLRTAPVPMALLSNFVRSSGYKVVLTGEGADEVFAGYNIFKENKIRRFWARYPDSKIRPMLLKKIYPYIQSEDAKTSPFWFLFFKRGIEQSDDRYYSHRIRWDLTLQCRKYFNRELRNLMEVEDRTEAALESYLGDQYVDWSLLAQAQYLEMKLFMPGYLLSSQGDRMLMANSVEGRFPFLDHRVIEFANRLPDDLKLRVLNEKYILKKTFQDKLPGTILNRKKQPYRSPVHSFNQKNNNLMMDMLAEDLVRKYGYFDPVMVRNLRQKIVRSSMLPLSARDEMSFVGIVTTHLLHHHFFENFPCAYQIRN
jgi:asparagine synthase (glutamine-hydrolysing)